MRKLVFALAVVAAAGFCTGYASAQDPALPSAEVTATDATLGIDESEAGWLLRFTSAPAAAPAVLFFGLDALSSPVWTLDLGVFGSVALSITYPDMPLIIGPSDLDGSMTFFIERPKELPKELLGAHVALQAVFFTYKVEPDASGAPIYAPNFYPTNPVEVLL